MRSPRIGALLLCATLAWGCSEQQAAKPPPPAPVRAALSTTGPGAPPISAIGRIETRDEMRLSFMVGGVIRQFAVRPGDKVRKGQKLAEIERTEVAAQVAQAREQAQKAERDRERGERLYADQVISLEQLEDLRTGAAVAQAQLEAARFNAGYAAIVAPRNGTVLQKLAEEREMVPAGQPVVVLGAEDRGFVVRTALSDREVVQLAVGDAAEVRCDAFPGAVLSGHVAEIATAADPATGTFPIEVRLEESREPLVTGLVARVAIVPAAAGRTTLTYVPIAAVVEGDGRSASVYVVDGAVAQRRPVEVAFITADAVALRAGVAPGERIVTDGALYLQDGQAIEVIEAQDTSGRIVAGADEPQPG